MNEPLNLSPTLCGNLVTLRPVRENDWDGMFEVASNPKVWADHVKRNRYKEEEFRPYFDSAILSGSALTIIDNETGMIIGTSRYHDYKPKKGEIEIGWTFIACEFWGGEYNAEVKSLMLRHVFSFLDIVVFWVAKDNLISQSAMKKIGGVLRDGEFSKVDNGKVFPYVVFEIRKEDFPSGTLKANAV